MPRRPVCRSVVSSVVTGLAALLAIAAPGGYALANPSGQAAATDGAGYTIVLEGASAVVRAATGASDEPALAFQRDARSNQWRADALRSRGATPNRMGYAVTIAGRFAVVGCPWQNGFQGAAHVLERHGDTWTRVESLRPGDLGPYAHFGASVSFRADQILVGAPWQDLLRGAVYEFRRTNQGWKQRAKTSAPGAMPDQKFGAHIDGGSDNPLANDLVLHQALSAAMHVAGEFGPAPTVTAASDSLSWVTASDGIFEDRTEVKWAPIDRDDILYKILRDGVLIGVASSDDSLYRDGTGARGVTYTYCVVILDMGGGEGPSKCDTGSRVIRAPERLSASDGQFIDGVHLTWEDRSSVEDGFHVKRDGVVIATLDRNRRAYVDVTALPLAAYAYAVKAFDSEGNESNNATDDGFRGVVLPPLDVSATDGEYADSVRVRWVSQGGAAGFVVTRTNLATTQSTVLDTTTASAQEYFDGTAQLGVRYRYCVTALDTLGRLSVAACDDGGIDLVAPASVAASDSTFDDRVQVTWQDGSGLASGYYIWRDGTPIDTVGASQRTYNDRDAGANATHTYCVLAFNGNGGTSAPGCDAGFRMIVLAPSNVRASDGDFENRTQIAWESSSTTVAVFKLFRNGAFIKSVGAGSRSYGDERGTAGKEYTYGVQAVTGKLEASTTTTDPGRRELKAPINVKATNDEFEDRVEISWRDISAVEAGHVVYRTRISGGATDSIGQTGTGVTTFADRTGEPRVTYRYGVTGFDLRGEARGESDVSEEDEGVRTLLRPTAVNATDGEFEDRIEITWKDHSNVEDGYRVYRDGVQIAATADNVTSIFDLHPPFGIASEYSVRAFDRYGASKVDQDSGSTTILAPGSFNASDTYEDRIVLRWVDVSEIEEGYTVQVDSAGIAVRTHSTAAGATSFADANAVAGVTYDYRLRAVSGAAVSGEARDSGVRPVSVYTVSTTALDGTLARMKETTGRISSNFGWAIAVSGDVLIVGSPGDNPRGANSGSAYAYERGPNLTWTQKDNFWAEQDGVGGDRFGEAVAIDGNMAIIGMPRRQQQYGSFGVYSGLALMFNRHSDGTWSEGSVLSPVGEPVGGDPRDPSDSNDRFGQAVAISQDMWVIGAPADNLGPQSNVNVDFGAIYFYKRGAGSPTKFFASDAANGDSLGASVAILGDWAAAGAPGRDDRGNHAGAVYVFKRFIQPFGRYDWSEYAKLTATDATAGASFGRAVLRTGDRIFVGAPRDVGINSGPGTVHVFVFDPEDSTWKEEATLRGSANGTDRFGTSLAIWNNWLIVGAPGEGAGAFYVFLRDPRTGWSTPSRFVSNGGEAGDRFGEMVAIGSDWAFAGAREDDIVSGAGTLADAGSVYPLLVLGTVTDVVASDGTVSDRVHIEWRDHSASEEGHIIYRDGVEYDRLGANEYFYDDINAQPGRAYEYSVAAINSHAALPSERASDFGWRPPNGAISGKITAQRGSGVPGVSVCLEPTPARALLFDGVGGHVEISDDGTFNFTVGQDFTIEAWFRYAGSDRTPRIISKLAAQGARERPIDMGLQRNGRLFFTMSDGANVARVLTRRNDLSGDTWHHVACVHDARLRRLTLYIDAVPEDSVSTQALGDVTNLSDVFLGGFGADTWYGGQLDELRIWNVPRSKAAINASKGAPLAGSEPGLLGYWPVDEISGLTITDFAGVAQYGSFIGGVYRTDQVAPMAFCTTTDADGVFVIPQIRYEQNGTSFKLRPSLGDRQFTPAIQPVTLNRDHPVQNQVVFSDISSHDVSGAVRFAGTNCFEPDVEIWVDNAAGAASDRNGKFSMALTEGVHTLRAQRRDYTYRVAFRGDTLGADSVTIDVKADVRDLVFLNRTTYPVSGKVGGGCERYVGEVSLRFRSENNCFDTTFVGNPKYAIHLPPMRYFASATIDRETIPGSLVRPDVITFFENLGEREVDLVAVTDSTVIDDRLDFIYRAPLRVSVRGLEPYVDATCGQLALEDGALLPAGLPILPQGQSVELTIRVEEAYGDSVCPLDTGLVIITDEFADREDKPDTLTISGGMVSYATFASTPSLVRGRTEGRNDRSFQKYISVKAVVEGRAPVVRTEWALITGHVAPQGAEFVTSPATEIPMLILRDPPGDGSYAYWGDGSTTCSRLTWTSTQISGGGGISLEIKAGATSKVWAGVGGGIITNILAHGWTDLKIIAGLKWSSEKSVDVCVSTTQRLATSAAPGFVGADADLFVGLGITFLFAEVGVIRTQGCVVEQSTAIGFEADSIHTTYAFTQQHIRDVLIPELRAKVAYYQAQNDPDSATVFDDMRAAWDRQLEYNRKDKQARVDTVLVDPLGLLPPRVVPREKSNRSFSAGANYELSTTSSIATTINEQLSLYVKGEAGAGVEFGPENNAHFKLGVRAETDNAFLLPGWVHDQITDASVVGYALSDDDAGDNFTVDIVRPAEGGYIFDVLGGRSSCPYEPWLDLDSGAPSMVPRDDPRLFISPAERFGVAPDKPALFKLTIANQSAEARDYVVRLLSNSNPGGAIMRLNGSPITNQPTFSIDGAGGGNINAHEATLSVERGPSRFNYKDLRLVVEPVCGGDAFTSDTISFNVAYEGCSDIHLSGPDVVPGWVYNHADSVAGKQLDLVLSGYELVVDPSTPNLVEAVGIQYRYMGNGREGPGPWTDIREVAPGVVADFSMDGSPDTIMTWQPDSLANGAYKPLVDGIYEIRAYTVCSTGGRGYSNASTGTIDRRAPVVFGAPQPADGQLSLGEDIGATFNEPLDCDALRNATVTLKYVDGPRAGQAIPVKLTCNGETILLVPQADPAALDGRRLEASVSGVTDRVGNTMTSTVTWRFDYRKSLFTWSETRITREVALVTPGKVSARVVNGTNQAVDYEVTRLPGFLSLMPTLARGRLAPGGTRAIDFDVDPLITGGIHEGQVVVQAVNTTGTDTVAVATMQVVLDVSCAAPVWAIDPGRFEYSMSLVSRVGIAGGTLTGGSDVLAAFVGEQLRGVGHPRDVAGDTLVFLTVFSNRPTGEMVRFEVWDDDRCKRYRSTAERAPFNVDAVLGTTISPLILSAQDAPPGSVASFPLKAGWNWFSTNMVSTDMSVGSVLSSLAPTEGDIIKSRNAFAVFDPDTSIGWVGSLAALDNTSGYMIRLTDAGTLLQEGALVDPSATPVPVSNGWNWISYLPRDVHSVADALADLDRLGFLDGNEVLRTQAAFAEWNSGWFGSLDAMGPGVGYRLRLQDPGLPSTFNYPGNGPAAAPGLAGRSLGSETHYGSESGWHCDPGAFEFNMAAIVSVQGGGVDWRKSNGLVAAFVDDECRGVASLMQVPGIEHPLAFLTVQSNRPEGETIRFRAFDASGESVYVATTTLAFALDAVSGGLRAPIVLTLSPGTSSALPTAFALSQNHPNPFGPLTAIRFALPKEVHVALKVYDVKGALLRTVTDRKYPAGFHSANWDGKTSSGANVASGIYFYRLEAGTFVQVKKMALVR